MTIPAALDERVLRPLREVGGDELVDQLLTLFRGYTPKRLEGIRSGIEAENAGEVVYWAHSLRSGAASIGARELSERAARLEGEAKEARDRSLRKLPEAIHEGYRRLVSEYDELDPILKRYLSEREPSERRSA